METRVRLMAAGVGSGVLFLAVQLGALALVAPFDAAGYQAVEDPSNPSNSLLYLFAILIATGLILFVIKLGVERVLRVLIVGVSGLLGYFVFSVIIPALILPFGIHVAAWGLALLIMILLYVYPEWYVIDTAGVVIGAGAAGLFGISFGPLPAILLLGALAVYDAISVYRTEHMLTLADSVTNLKLPLVLVIPLSLSYSFLDPPSGSSDVGSRHSDDDIPSDNDAGDSLADDDDREGLDREAFYIGLGDTVMPTIMVASAAFFVTAPTVGVLGFAITVPTLSAMLGTFLGLGILLWFVAQGRAHAGLPLLNGGAIGGYLIGAYISGIPLVDAVGITPYL